MHADRARGAFLGLAIGDAYGRSLEFVTGDRVRTMRVAIPSSAFMWTDDTHMSLFLVDALESLGAAALRRFPEDDFGRAVGEAFVRWSHDPLTPSTAPGNTCLRGAEDFEHSGNWRTSGVRSSDGCGAVMRIVPLPIVLSGAPLVTAARVQAVVTHAHENAPASAIAACLLLRELLEGAPLDAALVARTRRRLTALGASTTAVDGALAAAVEQAARPSLPWLDEGHIPDGDGGWRSPSALGLALVAALRWTDDPRLAIEKAARIDGDSDSVACLTGMFLGAVHGISGLPADWLAALPHRDQLHRAVDRLLALAPHQPAPAPPIPSGARTSATDPIQVAWLPVDVGARGGRLGLTFAPGKHAPSTLGRPWARDLAADLDRMCAASNATYGVGAGLVGIGVGVGGSLMIGWLTPTLPKWPVIGKLLPPDVQAPIALIQAAGGIVTDWQGNPAHNGGCALAAANPEIHAAALALLQQA